MPVLASLPLDAPPERIAAFRAPPLRATRAQVIRDDTEAIATAHRLAEKIRQNAVKRDRERILPHEELDWLCDAGLLAITVPKAYGGAEVSSGTLAEVVAILSAADGSIGQIPQNHFFILHALRLEGSEEQKRFFYGRILAGERIGNALSELGTKTAQDHNTRLSKHGPVLRLNGKKFYCTGALFAHWVAVVANDDNGRSTISLVPKGTPGLTVIDDWSGFGQRVTGSGTTVLDNVEVHPFSVISLRAVFDRPTSMGPVAQIMHAAVEAGIARAALAETVRFVKAYARPWKDSGLDHGYEDPYTIAAIGEVKIRIAGADALLERAGRLADVAVAEPTVETVAAASIAVAEAKVATTEASLLASSKLIELAGSRSTLQEFGLDRFWRNARTHTVHDPVRWKYRAIGDYWLNGINPPRHGAI
jgi:SfnB family sulfur acquisition oxidoreductase